MIITTVHCLLLLFDVTDINYIEYETYSVLNRPMSCTKLALQSTRCNKLLWVPDLGKGTSLDEVQEWCYSPMRLNLTTGVFVYGLVNLLSFVT